MPGDRPNRSKHDRIVPDHRLIADLATDTLKVTSPSNGDVTQIRGV